MPGAVYILHSLPTTYDIPTTDDSNKYCSLDQPLPLYALFLDRSEQTRNKKEIRVTRKEGHSK